MTHINNRYDYYQLSFVMMLQENKNDFLSNHFAIQFKLRLNIVAKTY